MGEGWKRAIAATKATRKKPKGRVFAIKSKKVKAAWMPDTCCVQLSGTKTGDGYLLVCGWSIEPVDETWDVERLKARLTAIAKDWREEFGAGWKLEIRPD